VVRQVYKEIEVTIIKRVLSTDHVRMFVLIPPHRAVSDVMRCVKGCTSRKIKMEFSELHRRYWGRHVWVRGHFCTTRGRRTITPYFSPSRSIYPISAGVSR